jgi:hypothetical protein
LAGPAIILPAGEVNFDGNGYFDQSVPGSFSPLLFTFLDGSQKLFAVPNPIPVGAEVFGVGTISDVALVSDLGSPVWLPADVGPNFEMTYSFWNAIVSSSGSLPFADPSHPGEIIVLLTSSYNDNAEVVLVSDTSKDFTNAADPVTSFDLATGDYPTAYTLPAGGAAVDPDESLFLDLLLSGNSSVIQWSSWFLGQNPSSFGFLGGAFDAAFLEINGGYGAAQFEDFVGPDGTADGFILNFNPLGWAYGADTDIQLVSVPEPAAIMSLFAGLALLGGLKLRRKQ